MCLRLVTPLISLSYNKVSGWVREPLISSPPDFGYSGLMLPETFCSNWRFGLGFFDKISLICRMSRRATISHLCIACSHQKPAFHGCESSNELRYSKKKVVCF